MANEKYRVIKSEDDGTVWQKHRIENTANNRVVCFFDDLLIGEGQGARYAHFICEKLNREMQDV